jgi:putative sigma-54 modulation protein
MQLSVTFRHMEASEAVRQYAREKVERIKKYFPDPIFAHVVVGTERGYQHACDVHIQLHNGLAIKGHETTEDMYSSIDLVMAKIERQVRRYKDKIRHHKAREGLSEMSVQHHTLESDGANGESAGATSEPATAPVPQARITKTDKFVAQVLHLDEALMQMDLAHQTFLVFRHHDTGQTCVVYKREDGNYGLIETQAAS